MEFCDIEHVCAITNQRDMPTSSLDSMLDEFAAMDATEYLEHDYGGVYFKQERDEIVNLFWDWWKGSPDRFNTTETPGDRLRECRKNCKMSQEKLAEMLSEKGARETISRWETGKNELPKGKAERLADILGVRPEYLLCEDCFRTKEEFREVIQGLEQEAARRFSERVDRGAEQLKAEAERKKSKQDSIKSLWEAAGYTVTQASPELFERGIGPDVSELSDRKNRIKHGVYSRYLYQICRDGICVAWCEADDMNKMLAEIEKFTVDRLANMVETMQTRVHDFELYESLIIQSLNQEDTDNG